ncbi:LLM class flavin-dependent oxidoreductase [Plantibacter sp. YIM 135347]|uniref:LLM class flavin-dependent oxidoreductase n=1 Tax=Plantibacter sp. YIM 135347 TaxID=3423919 RepID=UPI003D32D85A
MTDHAAPKPFKLGFLSHGTASGRTPGEHYRQVLDVIQAAEDLGYDGAWIAQHHLSTDIGVSSPLVTFAAAAARTSRIEFGTAITTIPLEDPLRLAEDVAVLDALSGGRFQLGLGSGGANQGAFTAFGLDSEEARAIGDEKTAALRSALRGEPIRDTGLVLQPPAASVADRIWRSTSSPERAARIAADGDGLLLGTAFHDPLTVQRPLLDRYLGAWNHEAAPRVGVVRAIWPAVDRERALAEIAPAYAQRGSLRWAADGDRSTAEIAASLNVHFGSVEEIVASLATDPALFPFADYLIPVVDHAFTPVDDVIRRLEIIATEIAPAFGWVPPGARRQPDGFGREPDGAADRELQEVSS